ncbi:ubiquitin-specific protease [Martiniozyma asiatica (nom. inval.)]|nr:ubiquitin-specific protease [Martiniozyma asiatica]
MSCDYLNSVDLSTIKLPSSTEPVFKDDCMFSFDTAFDPQGLDICMTCHQSFSRGDINYTQMHAEFFEHKLFLNYKKVQKPKKGEEQPWKMIKLEIKEQSDDDLFDTKCSIYCQEIDESFNIDSQNLPLKIFEVSNGIIKATSNERKEEIKSWTQEIKSCAHSASIIQKPLEHLNIYKCGECGLTENLWICLHCGNIGCGREQFGGVPGNSHAVAHHQKISDHCVAVKLGSLAVDLADSYCYSCDDEVQVPNLANLLKTFNIDITSFVKTEKNLTELQIEQNIQWDFKMDGKDGTILKPIFGEGLTGFKNLGNSCYLASVLQVLFTLDPFKEAFLNENGMPLDKILGNYQPWKDLETQMFKIGDGLWSGRYSIADNSTTETVKYQRGIKPTGFKALIGEGHPEFSTMLQQDAFEFWTYLLDTLEKKNVKGKVNYSLTDCMKFVLQSKIQCLNCGCIKLTKELTENVSIPIKEELNSIDKEGIKSYQQTTIENGFEIWKAPESIEYKCPKCDSMQQVVKSEGFLTFPKYLTINPQRIKLENWVPVKVSVPIKFEERLSIHKFVSEGQIEGEELLPEVEETEYQFNKEAIQSLIEMGFPEIRAKRGLYATGNSNAEAAMNWLFEHMDDPDIDDPFTPENKGKEPNAESISMMLSMGLNEKLCKKALILHNDNVEQAIEWVFSNPDDNGELEIEESAESSSDKIKRFERESHETGEYELLAVICHKGTSPHSGHYVAFVKKIIEGSPHWVLFNDEKVVLADEESLKEVESSGYLYIYKSL